MECNRDEALRAKAISESKWEKKDYVGAKKFALKAQTLYAGLDGLHQMIETFNVYVSAENKISGEVDWYGVLGVNPSADDETIRKQYRKFALMLHPDKNKSVGAEGAFKLISEAWTLLSDKARRLAYNKRRSSNGLRHVPKHDGTTAPRANEHGARPKHDGTTAPRANEHGTRPKHDGTTAPRANEHSTRPKHDGTTAPRANEHGTFSRKISVPTAQNNNVKVPPTKSPAPCYKKNDTFWTMCRRCKMHYEYVRLYLNTTLRCPSCKEGFMASEIAPPFNYSEKSNSPPPQQQQTTHNHASRCNVYDHGKNDAYTTKQAGPGQSCPNSFLHANIQQNSVSGSDADYQRKKASNAKQSGPYQSSSETLRYANIRHNSISGAAAYDHGKSGAHDKHSGSDHSCPNSVRYTSIQQSSVSGIANVPVTDPSIAVKAANVVQQAQDKLKRAHNESHSARWETYIKKRKLGEDLTAFEMNNSMAMRNSGYGTSGASSGSKISGFYNSIKEPTPFETRNSIIIMTRKEILKKVAEWQSETLPKYAVKEKGNTKTTKKETHRGINNLQEHNQNGDGELFLNKKAELAKTHEIGCASDNVNEEVSAGVSMNVPDSDFHDFDMDRTENSFGDNEVWAAYDDDDGMPRFYALVNKVISRKPFKLKISWLNSKTNSEFSSIDWISSGFYKTCGEFRVGKYETCKSINSFSHKISWTKGPRGTIIILPQKGDVWALYRNWSSDWNEQTPDEVIHNYDMVTVLDDYSDERGISVAPLMKMAGFRTVFRRNLEPGVIMCIPKEEMLRFSHRVPMHLITGQEARNVPADCLDLDPAATPLELLQVMTGANDIPVTLNKEKEKVKEHVLESVRRTGSNEISMSMNETQDASITEICGDHHMRKGTVRSF